MCVHLISVTMPRNPKPKQRLSTYKTLSISKKLAILEEANKDGVSDRSIATKHGISSASIGDWRKQQKKLEEEMRNHRETKKQVTNSVSRHSFPEMEIILYTWIMDQREGGLVMTTKMVMNLAKEIQSNLYPGTSFHASRGWFQKFCVRQQLSFRKKSTLNQHDPVNIINKVLSFFLYFHEMKEKFPDAAVWACDETPVFFLYNS